MGMYLIAAGSSLLDPQWWWVIFQVAFGLGAVIFVHELGHFAVAKMCGVKCEKFYIGFDIGGWKLCKFQWGETEYGIGVLPLGGYVKMLGQEDNPSRVAEELERAKQPGSDVSGLPAFKLDPRSYLAQSVPKRMAIISAGVIMNVIFAWIFASIAYGLGVEYSPTVVSGLSPGEAAWQSDLRVGDEITRIGDLRKPRFQDLMNQVAFGDLENGLPLRIKRPGVETEFSVTVYPVRKESGYAPRIGVRPPLMPQLSTNTKAPPTLPDSPAARAKPPFAHGDKIVAVNGQPIETYAQMHAQLARHPGEPLTFVVERALDKQGKPVAEHEKSATTTRLSIAVEPNPLRELGVAMKMGPIAAVQANSPAAAAGIKPGDVLLAIDGNSLGDPMTLPERLRRRGGQMVQLKLRRSDEPEAIEITAQLREPDWYDIVEEEGQPLSAPALGIAYDVHNEVTSIDANSPAAKAGLKPGDQVTAVKFIEPPKQEGDELRRLEYTTLPKFAKTLSWPAALEVLQRTLPGTKVELTLKEGRQVTLEPIESSEWFNPVRGITVRQLQYTRTAESFSEALALGGRETGDSLFMVVRFLQKIGSQVSPMAMGGIGSIFGAATSSAERGLAQLLIFLCMLSANLAIINMLPIPVLDGGHMVFLVYEGLFRKPVPEKWFLAATYAGFLFVLGLLLFANGLDVFRWLS